EFVLVATNAPVRLHIPIDSSADATWSLTEFDDASWSAAANGIGFDAAGFGYNSVIASDVGSRMAGANSTIFLRIPFSSTATEFNSLSFRVLYDDGFVAFLNDVA